MMKKMNATIETMAPAIATEIEVPTEDLLRSVLRSADLGGLGGEDVRLSGGQKVTW